MKNPHHGRPDYEKTTGNNRNCRHPFRPDTPFYSRKTPKLAKISNRNLDDEYLRLPAEPGEFGFLAVPLTGNAAYPRRFFGKNKKLQGPFRNPAVVRGRDRRYATSASSLVSADFGVISALASSSALALMNSQISSFSSGGSSTRWMTSRIASLAFARFFAL